MASALSEPLRLGVIGLGRAFTLMLPTFVAHPRVKLVAATDPREDAVARFAREFDAAGHPSAEALCSDPKVQAVYVASPHQFHVSHVTLAAANKKHVLVEKPMALSLADCREMIAAARAAGVHLLVGHSHSYDLPYLRAAEMIRSGAYGALRMITALNFTDFLYRPRRPEELDTEAGGGVVFSQAAHQIDVARLLAPSKATAIRALTGRWDAKRPTEGAYSAQMSFEDGSFAALTYSGYAHFDTDVFLDWRGELGQTRDPNIHGAARQKLRTATSAANETALKNARAYGLLGKDAFGANAQNSHNHFGLFIASCDRADLRPTPAGIEIHGDFERSFEPLPAPTVPRADVVDELCDVIAAKRRPLHTGEWGMATLEACLGILSSAKSGHATPLKHQVVC